MKSSFCRAFVLKQTALLLSLICLFSCTKNLDQHNDDSTSFSAAQAKEWYYGSFKKSQEYKTGYAQDKKLPDWKNPYSYKIGNVEFVEFPLVKVHPKFSVPSAILNIEDKKRLAETSLSRVVFIKDGSNMVVRELSYIPDLDFARSKQFDISSCHLGNSKNDFSGRVVIQYWNGKIVSTSKYIKGILTQKGKIIDQKQATSSPQNLDGQYCSTWEFCYYIKDCEMVEVGDGWWVEVCGPWENTMNCWLEEYCYSTGNDPCEGLSPEVCACQLYGYCGGGDEPPLPTACDMTNQEGQDALNGMSSSTPTDPIIETYDAGVGSYPEVKQYRKAWPFEKLMIIPGYEPQWYAHFQGVIERATPTSPWKFQSCTVATTPVTREGVMPPCFSENTSANVMPPLIQPDGLKAKTGVSWTITVSVSCAFGLEVATRSGSEYDQELQP